MSSMELVIDYNVVNVIYQTMVTKMHNTLTYMFKIIHNTVSHIMEYIAILCVLLVNVSQMII